MVTKGGSLVGNDEELTLRVVDTLFAIVHKRQDPIADNRLVVKRQDDVPFDFDGCGNIAAGSPMALQSGSAPALSIWARPAEHAATARTRMNAKKAGRRRLVLIYGEGCIGYLPVRSMTGVDSPIMSGLK